MQIDYENLYYAEYFQPIYEKDNIREGIIDHILVKKVMNDDCTIPNYVDIFSGYSYNFEDDLLGIGISTEGISRITKLVKLREKNNYIENINKTLTK